MRNLLTFFFAVVISATALAAPDKTGWSSGERAQNNASDVAKKLTYGMCSAPQNADAYPGSPQKIVVEDCNDFSQQFVVTAAKPSSNSNCGGFTVAFGPLGDLKPHLHQITMTADWGDDPVPADQCQYARVTAIAWGERCLDDVCMKTDWYVIGGPKQRKGKWDAASRTCKLDIKFTSTGKQHKTLNLDVIATHFNGAHHIRKREKGTIRAEIKSDKACYSAEGKVATKEKR